MQEKNLPNVEEITYIETTVSTDGNKNLDVKKRTREEKKKEEEEEEKKKLPNKHKRISTTWKNQEASKPKTQFVLAATTGLLFP